ncbi:substrate-binding domain-containing protein [Ottowia sp. SB7-C50]|nr:substrate-binding domain-containing protein [Ottowia sp. SB7-C50]WOP17170.1 substrate-binding domain-containing protein [Ottowia sp. SB7-C50]
MGSAKSAAPSAANANEVRVISSGGFTAAYKTLAPLYEAASGVKIVSSYGASIGNAPDSIPSRLARGEKFDIVILADNGLEALVRQGKVAGGSRVDLGRSLIGASVKKGTPKPDISTVPALKNALLNAKSIAYSASASGTYLSEELFPKLGVAERTKVTAKKIMSERVGAVVARGDAELGFQQASELLPFTELDYLGPIPDEVQQKVFFSAGLMADAPNPEGARRFIRYLASPAAAGVIKDTGLDPVAKP